jgi:nicotinate-nucleotide adenylyltransferase
MGKIGVLGGTFNPVHNGHIYLAGEVIKKLSLDKVIFVPSKITPLRRRSEIIDSEERFKLIQLAIKDYHKFELSRLEIDKAGVSYTIDTLRALREKFGKEAELFFIAGSDLAGELNKWKDFDQILKLSNFVIVRRPNYELPPVDEDIMVIDIEAKDISSCDIRKRIKNNEDFKDLVPDVVYRYLKEKGLYRN